MRPDIRDKLILEGLELEVDERRHAHCPFCEAAHEDSLWLLRTENGLFYECFRAKCGAKGFVSSTGQYREAKPKSFKPRKFTGTLTTLPDDIRQLAEDRWGITSHELEVNRVKYAMEDRALYMPLMNIHGFEYGAETKLLYPKQGQRKSMRYFDNEETHVHFPIQWSHTDDQPLVVVEDILSSIKAARILRSAALLGCELTERKALVLRMFSKDLVLALDPDAVHKAFTFRKKYGLLFRSFQVAKLSDDPKDLPEEQLEEELSYYYDKNREDAHVGNDYILGDSGSRSSSC